MPIWMVLFNTLKNGIQGDFQIATVSSFVDRLVSAGYTSPGDRQFYNPSKKIQKHQWCLLQRFLDNMLLPTLCLDSDEKRS